MFFRKFTIFILLALSLSCARVVRPTGGPADKEAPIIESSTPENFSTRYNSNKIVINFDEFIILKDFNQQFVSSPILNKTPEKTLRGKSLILKLDKDSLLENTTYTLDFGNSLVDYHAGNEIKNYQYVFSTGDYIDSLYISGKVFLAKDLIEQEQIWVLLYKNINDSILKNTKPDFIAKTDKEGNYSINNIGGGSYGIFALKDINNNYIFDLPNEQIAFLDSLFIIEIEENIVAIIPDSLIESLEDSIHLPENQDINFNLQTDSLESLDSLNEYHHVHYKVYPEYIDLYLFEEAFKNNYLLDFTRPKAHLLSFAFSESQDSSVTFSLQNLPDKNWIIEPNIKKDTFNIWLLDSAISNLDSLTIILNYYKSDSTLTLVSATDSLPMNFTKKEVFKSRKEKKRAEKDSSLIKIDYLSLSANFRPSYTEDYYKTLNFKFGFPVFSVDKDKITLFQKVDTTYKKVSFSVSKDSTSSLLYSIDYQFEEDSEYKIFVEPGSIIDYRGLFNDTLDLQFKTTKVDSYSEISIDITGIEKQVIIQLVDGNEKLLYQEILIENKKVNFIHLKPGKYNIKLIKDSNFNGIWDTGNYLKKIQPETVIYYKENITTKANWTNELEWNLKQ